MSGHLVIPLRVPVTPCELSEGLQAPRTNTVIAAARATVPRLLALPARSWGANAKREHVTQGWRPSLVSPTIKKHSFVES